MATKKKATKKKKADSPALAQGKARAQLNRLRESEGRMSDVDMKRTGFKKKAAKATRAYRKARTGK